MVSESEYDKNQEGWKALIERQGGLTQAQMAQRAEGFGMAMPTPNMQVESMSEEDEGIFDTVVDFWSKPENLPLLFIVPGLGNAAKLLAPAGKVAPVATQSGVGGIAAQVGGQGVNMISKKLIALLYGAPMLTALYSGISAGPNTAIGKASNRFWTSLGFDMGDLKVAQEWKGFVQPVFERGQWRYPIEDETVLVNRMLDAGLSEAEAWTQITLLAPIRRANEAMLNAGGFSIGGTERPKDILPGETEFQTIERTVKAQRESQEKLKIGVENLKANPPTAAGPAQTQAAITDPAMRELKRRQGVELPVALTEVPVRVQEPLMKIDSPEAIQRRQEMESERRALEVQQQLATETEAQKLERLKPVFIGTRQGL